MRSYRWVIMYCVLSAFLVLPGMAAADPGAATIYPGEWDSFPSYPRVDPPAR